MAALHWEKGQLADAKAKSDAAAAALAVQHNALDAKVEEQKEKSPDLAHHYEKRTRMRRRLHAYRQARKPGRICGALKKTEEIAENQKTLPLSTSASKRTKNYRNLCQ